MSWFCAIVAPRQEKAVLQRLGEQGLSAWAPMERRVRHAQRAKVEIETPLFPGYVFVEMGDHPRYAEVRDTPGVWNFVQVVGEGPAQLQPRWVRLIQRAERMGLFDKTQRRRRERRLQPGDQARIRDGADEGKVVQIIKGGTEERLRILLGAFVGTIERRRLEPLPKAA